MSDGGNATRHARHPNGDIERRMAQVAIQLSTVDLETVDSGLREAHARFLRQYQDALVTFGPIRNADGSPAGYAYQTDFPGTTMEAMHRFLAEDPFTNAGLIHACSVNGWRCALKVRQASMKPRPGLQGFFFYGIGKPNVTARRNEVVDAHRAHLMAVDESNCVSRGPITNGEAKEWLGSAMIYEFLDRRALDAFFEIEPYCASGLYERIDIYHWRPGELAAARRAS
jgi:uncharacterized protein YciI